jgi:hypothetical protein
MKNSDDNLWADYTLDYLHQIIEVYRDGGDFFISPDGLEYTENGIIFKDRIHGNSQEIYSLVYKLKPISILECGCGGCYHLKNISKILPDADIHGFDITESQINFGKWFARLPKSIEGNLSVMDFTKKTIPRQFEFVYTQAVIMHLSTANAYKAMLNMKAMSGKYVFMIENPNHHGGMDLWTEMVYGVFTHCSVEHVGSGLLITKQ